MRKSREKQRVARTWNAGNFVFPKRARALCAGISGGWWAPSACGNGTCTDRRAGATLAKLVERETDRTEGGVVAEHARCAIVLVHFHFCANPLSTVLVISRGE